MTRVAELISRPLIVGVLLLVAAACVGSAARAAEERPVKLKIGTSNTFGFAATFAARGDDKTPGFEFEIIPFAGGSPQEISALNAGVIDIAELGEVGPVVAQSADVPFKIIAATQPWGVGQGILVNADSPIRAIEDLKGKRVSYSRGTNSHWVIIKALQSVGLTMDDIQSVFLPASANIQAVLASGGIDAAVSIDTLLTAFERSGSRRVASGSDVGAENPLYYIASEEALTNHEDAVAAFVKQLARHVAWSHSNPEERGAVLAKILRIDPEVAIIAERKRPASLRPIDATLVKNNQTIADLFFAQGVIPKRVDAASSFTTEFNGQAVP